MQKILGGNPLSIIFRLIVLSIIVGLILTLLGLSPFDLIDNVRVAFLQLYHMGYGAIGWIVRYFLIGAVIVIPVWLIGRFWHLLSKGGDGKS